MHERLMPNVHNACDSAAIIIQLVSGALVGNAVGALMKKLSLGTEVNSIVGILD